MQDSDTMTAKRLKQVLSEIEKLSLGLVGDFFVDRYFDIEPRRVEASLETGLDAHQVVRVRTYPGGGGNVAQNLTALGVGRVMAVTCLGQDADGFELKGILDRLGVDTSLAVERPDFMTPSYNKPILLKGGKPSQELERLDARSRSRLPREIEEELLQHLERCMGGVDGLLIADQVPENNCGLITARVRRRVAELTAQHPEKIFFADSRCRIGKFRKVIIKPNQHEAAAALGKKGRTTLTAVREGALVMSRRTGRPVYVTLGGRGCLSVHDGIATTVPTYRPGGKLDIVGAGDSFFSGAMTALCAGAAPEEAGLIGNLVASITVQQVGVCGTATQAQVRRRFSEFRRQQERGR